MGKMTHIMGNLALIAQPAIQPVDGYRRPLTIPSRGSHLPGRMPSYHAMLAILVGNSQGRQQHVSVVIQNPLTTQVCLAQVVLNVTIQAPGSLQVLTRDILFH